MNKLYTTLIAIICFSTASMAQTLELPLSRFEKVIINPYIDVTLVKGDKEAIEFTYDGISSDKLGAEVRGRTLHVFLEDAEINLRLFKRDFDMPRRYKWARVKAKITYVTLKKIDLRGEENLVCEGELSTRNLKFIAYGENDIKLNSVNTGNFKVALYGENTFAVNSGSTYNQIYNTYGENKINAENFESSAVRSKSFGDNIININATDFLEVVHFGEGRINYVGNPVIERKWLIGETQMRRIK
ncbi:MAG: DUF2807 domain-containing protein [Fulvivirga sp.]